MSDSDFPFHVSDEFTDEVDCEVGTDCIAQPFKANDFVLIKLATKKQWIILLSWYKMGPDICTVTFERKWLTSWKLCFPKPEDTAAINPGDIVLKLPDLVVAGSSCRIMTDFGVDLLGYSVNWSWYSWSWLYTFLPFDANCQAVRLYTVVTLRVPVTY